MDSKYVDVTAAVVDLVTALIGKNLVSDPATVPVLVGAIGSALSANPTSAGTIAGLLKEMISKGNITDASLVAGYISDIGCTISLIGAAVSSPAQAAAAPAPAQPLVPLAAVGPVRFMTAAEQGVSPAVPIRESVTPDFIICLEDGVKKKMLKRHLTSSYGISAEQYRARWGLPRNYPLVAPNYAKQKSKYAKCVGLGTHRMRDEVRLARSEPAAATPLAEKVAAQAGALGWDRMHHAGAQAVQRIGRGIRTRVGRTPEHGPGARAAGRA